jgi:hypothetical protein
MKPPLDAAKIAENYMRADLKAQAFVEGEKQRLSYVAWSVASITPGMLTLADKGAPLRVGSVLDGARFLFAASEVAFVLSIGLAMLIHWLITKRIELTHADRIERINQVMLLFAQEQGGTPAYSADNILKLYEASRANRASIEKSFGSVEALRAVLFFQQLFLACGYLSLVILVLSQS